MYVYSIRKVKQTCYFKNISKALFTFFRVEVKQSAAEKHRTSLKRTKNWIKCVSVLGALLKTWSRRRNKNVIG